jgi:hypothetical protein
MESMSSIANEQIFKKAGVIRLYEQQCCRIWDNGLICRRIALGFGPA